MIEPMMAVPDYDPVELDRTVSRGATAGSVKLTRFLTDALRLERRESCGASRPSVGKIEFEAKTQAEAEALVAFWECRDGPVRAFRFYDWQEHAAGEPLARADRSADRAVDRSFAAVGERLRAMFYAPISATVTLRRQWQHLVGISVDYKTQGS